ncbi:ABC transporter permease [candidate division KSB1 bacterium]
MKSNEPKLPFFASMILKIFNRRNDGFSLSGDFEEEFYELAELKGEKYARKWYRRNMLRSVPLIIRDTVYWRFTMFKNYLKIALRNIKKHKVYSFINISGIAIGLACVILLSLFVENEITYDSFHKNKDRMYKVYAGINKKDGSLDWNLRSMFVPNAPAMKEFFSEIQYITRMKDWEFTVQYNEKLFNESITLVDKPFFEMFTFPLIQGDPQTVLAQQNSIVLTHELAKKYFGNENPVGKTLTLILGDYSNDYCVTGISEKPPSNSTVKFQMAADIECLRQFGESSYLENWNMFAIPNYVVLKNKELYNNVIEKFPAFEKQYYSSLIGRWAEKRGPDPISFGLQKMNEVHLDNGVTGSPQMDTILILTGIALTILIIACINFINLSISMSSLRSIEIGIRKVFGADRKQLVRQFWSESVIITFIAMTAGIFIACLLLPSFSRFSEKELNIDNLLNINNILILLILTIVIGVISGSYPAFIMSGFKSVTILKGKLKLGGKNYFTRLMVVIQFSLSVFLIVSTIVMGEQIKYLLNMDLGFNKEGVVTIDVQERNPASSDMVFTRFKDKLNSYDSIINISASSSPFGLPYWTGFYNKEGIEFDYYFSKVEYDIFKTMNIDIVEGRSFSKDYSTDITSVIINQKFANKIGLENPVGKQLDIFDTKLTIIGIVKDFKIGNLEYEIYPALFHMLNTSSLNNIMVRISTQNLPEKIELMRKTWKDIKPDKPFIYSFLDDKIKAQYDNEKRWGAIIRYSAGFAVLIACMGIFGLTSLTINRKVKEIGIRKVLGAKFHQIIKFMLKEFILMAAISNIIAWPAAYYALDKYLENYFYKISLDPQYFILSAALSIIIVTGTIIYLVAKAASANPVDSLRNE